MFCPNCGKDCGNNRFCISCGTRIQPEGVQESRKAEWRVGMPCPYCGGKKLKDNCCAFCGSMLCEETHQGENEVSYDIPCGLYKGVLSSITLYDRSLVIANRPLFKKYETRIPYDQITSLVYVRPHKVRRNLGYLLVRWEGNKDLPIPHDYHLSGDQTAVCTTDLTDLLFYHIFCMLRTVAPSTAECIMVVQPDEIAEQRKLNECIDLAPYFEKYAPHREQAIEAVCKRNGVTEDTAKYLINCFFDARQKERYEADPMAAIQDLNVVVNEIRRKKAEELEKIRQQRKEQEILSRLDAIAENRDNSY